MLNDLGVIHVNNHWLKKVTLAPPLENYVPSLLLTLAGDTSQHSSFWGSNFTDLLQWRKIMNCICIYGRV